MKEVGVSLDEGHREGILTRRPGIVNLQCDLDHPTQTLSDLLHLKNHFGSLAALKGKKIAITWAYSPTYGKPLSVPQGLIALLTRYGMQVSVAYPPGYELLPEVEKRAKIQADSSGGGFEICRSMEEAFSQADIVYPKSWGPLRQMRQKANLFLDNDQAGLRELEKECLRMNARHIDWECTASRMELTRKGDGVYMHCLPADISGLSCERGEVSRDVFEKHRLATYYEAGYKPFVIASMIMVNRFENPLETLRRLTEDNIPRIYS
jgi:knotted carbamoyltransferase YgeW